MTRKLIAAVAAACALSFATPAASAEAGKAIVSLYRAAPGQQLALLKWMAGQDRAAVAAGVGPSQIYVHMSGDSWDYLVINPMTTPAEDDAIEAAAKKMGLPAGPKASLEFRTMIAVHTDTLTNGPTTAGELVAKIEK